MNRFLLVFFVFLALGAGRVAAQNATSGFAGDADFSKYKTYKWVPIESAQYLDELTSGQLTGTLQVELAKKGLTRSPSATADLYIGYQIVSGDSKHLNLLVIGTEYHPPAEAAPETSEDTSTIIHSGTLVLYLFDSANKRLVWWSLTPNAIDADANPDKKQKRLDKAIEKLLNNYPPKKKP